MKGTWYIALSNFGLRSPNAVNGVFVGYDPTLGTLAVVLIANTPQLIVSIFYFLYNGLLTCMLLAAEYNDYARHRKPLRSPGRKVVSDLLTICTGSCQKAYSSYDPRRMIFLDIVIHGMW